MFVLGFSWVTSRTCPSPACTAASFGPGDTGIAGDGFIPEAALNSPGAIAFARLPDSPGAPVSEGLVESWEQARCGTTKQIQTRTGMQISRRLPAGKPLNRRVGY